MRREETFDIDVMRQVFEILRFNFCTENREGTLLLNFVHKNFSKILKKLKFFYLPSLSLNKIKTAQINETL